MRILHKRMPVKSDWELIREEIIQSYEDRLKKNVCAKILHLHHLYNILLTQIHVICNVWNNLAELNLIWLLNFKEWLLHLLSKLCIIISYKDETLSYWMLWELSTENDRILQQNHMKIIQQAKESLICKINLIFLRELHQLKFKPFVWVCEHRIVKSLTKPGSPLIYSESAWLYKQGRGLHLCSKQIIVIMLSWTKVSSQLYEVQRYITEITI